jgi:hypothetical protein
VELQQVLVVQWQDHRADALKAGADVTKTMGQAGADATIEGVKTQAMQDAIFNVGNPAAKAVADTGQAKQQAARLQLKQEHNRSTSCS